MRPRTRALVPWQHLHTFPTALAPSPLRWQGAGANPPAFDLAGDEDFELVSDDDVAVAATAAADRRALRSMAAAGDSSVSDGVSDFDAGSGDDSDGDILVDLYNDRVAAVHTQLALLSGSDSDNDSARDVHGDVGGGGGGGEAGPESVGVQALLNLLDAKPTATPGPAGPPGSGAVVSVASPLAGATASAAGAGFGRFAADGSAAGQGDRPSALSVDGGSVVSGSVAGTTVASGWRPKGSVQVCVCPGGVC
jgi:hypothetical protein